MEIFHTFLPISGLEFNILILIAIGFAAGVLGSFFGVGGGWIATPALNIFGFPISFAIGTGLANISGQSAMATIKHRKMGNVDYALGITTGVFMVVGVECGAQVVVRLEAIGLAEFIIRCMYIVLLASLGGYMVYEYCAEMRKRALHGHTESHQVGGRTGNGGLVSKLDSLRIPPMITLRSCGVELSLWVIAATGLLAGFLAGLMGTGGGFALVPAFVYLIGTPTAIAVGTSLLCVIISGGYGAFTYALKGRLEVIAALWMLMGAAVGAQIGASAVRYVRGSELKLLYSLMLLLAATSVLLKQLGLSCAAAITVLGGAFAMCILIIGKMVFAVGQKRRST